MAFSAEIIIALTGLLTALGALLMSYRTAHRTERKDEITLLRDEVGRLQALVVRLRLEYEQRLDGIQLELDAARRESYRQREVIAWLRVQIREHGMELPPLPPELKLET